MLLPALDKLDDIAKAPLLARAFARYMQGEFDFSTFQRLAAAVDRCLIEDFAELEHLTKPKPLDNYVGDMLVSAGLVILHGFPGIRGPGAKNTYALSELGELFLSVVVRGKSRWA